MTDVATSRILKVTALGHDAAEHTRAAAKCDDSASAAMLDRGLKITVLRNSVKTNKNKKPFCVTTTSSYETILRK